MLNQSIRPHQNQSEVMRETLVTVSNRVFLCIPVTASLKREKIIGISFLIIKQFMLMIFRLM